MSPVGVFASLASFALSFGFATSQSFPAEISRLAPASRSTSREVGFTPMSAVECGVIFTNSVPPDRYLTNQIYLNGSGVALGDIDGDGRADIFLAAPQGGSCLFGNLGHWKFTNLTAKAFPPEAFGPKSSPWHVTGAVFGDVDGDGDLDLIINTVGQGTHIFSNDGTGHFSATTASLNEGHAGTSLALADADGDGDLDLYVANYRPNTIRDDPTGKFTIRDVGGRQQVVAYNGRSTAQSDLAGRFFVTPAGVKENGEPDALYLNDGHGRFSPVEWTTGNFLTESGQILATPPYDWGLSVLFRDVTGDGRPDLYVANDFESPDRFWINETLPGGPLRFRAAPTLALRHTSAFSMGVDAGDINRDGYDDLFVLDMLSRNHRERNFQVDSLPFSRHYPSLTDDRPQFPENTLFLGRGDGTFAEIGRLAGLAASEWSWTPIFLDVDLDGWEDLLISNGHELDMMDADVSDKSELLRNQRRMSPRELLDLRKLFRRFDAPNAAFRNHGHLAFTDESAAWGFDARNVTHGMALADLDGDGDLDVVQNNLNASPTLLRNDARAPRIAIRARAASANTHGIGARIRVGGGPVTEQSQIIMSGGRYLSSDDAMRVFAAGSAAKLRVEVFWPSGGSTVVSNVPPNSLVSVVESATKLPLELSNSPPTTWFVDVSEQLHHVAGDTAFNDFERQPLLPWSLAYPTPGATWADLDGDGRDELLIGTGVGGSPAIFRATDLGFNPLTNAALERPVVRDLTTLLAVGRIILAGSSNYRDGHTNGGALRVYDLDRGIAGDSVLGQPFAVGPLAMADVDDDGSPEMFIGGRAIAGRYPEPAPSLLLKSDAGRFRVVQQFAALGLVNSATFADLDGDGDEDLLVATEWGPLHFFRNEAGKLVPGKIGVLLGQGGAQAIDLEQLRGWWTSVAVGDFDGDGRLDFIAGNRGWNWFPVPRAPIAVEPGELPSVNRRRLRYGDFDGNGFVEILESYWIGDRELPLRRADALFAALPQLRDTFPTRAAFGAAELNQIVTALRLPPNTPTLDVDWFETSVFLNRGRYFERVPLPIEAQFAPVAGIAVADFDGDGKQDVFLAQNFFPVRADEARQDAGRGLLLRGNGRGNFDLVPGLMSGLKVWGDGRAAAVGDYNLDGRPDLVVTQNAGPTRLFRNQMGKPGLVVRLLGSPDNLTGIGTQMRLIADGIPGALQEVQAGSGWLSVDSPSRIMTATSTPTAIEIRWPGAAKKILPLPARASVVEVSHEGTLKVIR